MRIGLLLAVNGIQRDILRGQHVRRSLNEMRTLFVGCPADKTRIRRIGGDGKHGFLRFFARDRGAVRADERHRDRFVLFVPFGVNRPALGGDTREEILLREFLVRIPAVEHIAFSYGHAGFLRPRNRIAVKPFERTYRAAAVTLEVDQNEFLPTRIINDVVRGHAGGNKAAYFGAVPIEIPARKAVTLFHGIGGCGNVSICVEFAARTFAAAVAFEGIGVFLIQFLRDRRIIAAV